MKKLSFLNYLLSFLMGLTGQLFVSVPGAGIMPMLDVVSYVIAIPLLILLWGKMGRFAHRTILWGIAWALASILANLLNYYTSWYFWKSVTVVSSGWILMVVAWWVLNKDASLFLIYLLGAGVGGFISLYYFQNGAYAVFANTEGLIEKQIYPFYARAIVYCGLLPFCWFFRKHFPSFVIVVTILAGVFLLFNGGSRSGFGIYLLSGGFGFLAVYCKRVVREICKNLFLTALLLLLGVGLVFFSYSRIVQEGALGEGERSKFEAEEGIKMDTGHGRVSARAGLEATWRTFKKQPWGEGGTLRRHSVISNSWNCEGLVGLLFWVYFFWIVLWYIRKRMFYSGIFAVFIGLQIMIASWDVVGSPFGTRNIFFSLMIYIALCRDNPYYGKDTVFEDFPKYLIK